MCARGAESWKGAGLMGAAHECRESSRSCLWTLERGRVDPEGLRVQSQAIWDIQGGPLSGTELASCLCHEFSLTTHCWSVLGQEAPVHLPIPLILSAPTVSATLMWRNLTNAPWTGCCWARQLHLARRHFASVAQPSRPPSSLPVTMSGSSSTQTPPAPARPRASASPISEVMQQAFPLAPVFCRGSPYLPC